MLHRFDHPLGKSWNCSECAAKTESGHACGDCHALLCDACAARDTHKIPAGYRADKICSPSPRDLPIATTPSGESAAA